MKKNIYQTIIDNYCKKHKTDLYSVKELGNEFLSYFFIEYNKYAIKGVVKMIEEGKKKTGKDLHYIIDNHIFRYIGKRKKNETVNEYIQRKSWDKFDELYKKEKKR